VPWGPTVLPYGGWLRVAEEEEVALVVVVVVVVAEWDRPWAEVWVDVVVGAAAVVPCRVAVVVVEEEGWVALAGIISIIRGTTGTPEWLRWVGWVGCITVTGTVVVMVGVLEGDGTRSCIIGCRSMISLSKVNCPL